MSENDDPPEDTLGYQKMVQRALRGVVREAVAAVVEHGLPGQHHFYISFRTDAPGVEIADRLHLQHPKEMTVVLQHQFWGLEVSDHAFTVTLSFDGSSERLVIPFDAVTSFVDPSVDFGLQFEGEQVAETAAGSDPPDPPDPPDGDDGGERKTGEVVALDKFRKKK